MLQSCLQWVFLFWVQGIGMKLRALDKANELTRAQLAGFNEAMRKVREGARCKESQVDILLNKLASMIRTEVQQVLGREFSDLEKANLSKGYEGLEDMIREILLGDIVSFEVIDNSFVNKKVKI